MSHAPYVSTDIASNRSYIAHALWSSYSHFNWGECVSVNTSSSRPGTVDSSCLSDHKKMNQIDQSNSLYSLTFWYSLHLIGQFGFSFSVMGQAN